MSSISIHIHPQSTSPKKKVLTFSSNSNLKSYINNLKLRFYLQKTQGLRLDMVQPIQKLLKIQKVVLQINAEYHLFSVHLAAASIKNSITSLHQQAYWLQQNISHKYLHRDDHHTIMIIWPYSKAIFFHKFYGFFMILPPFFAPLQHSITVQDYHQRQDGIRCSATLWKNTDLAGLSKFHSQSSQRRALTSARKRKLSQGYCCAINKQNCRVNPYLFLNIRKQILEKLPVAWGMHLPV